MGENTASIQGDTWGGRGVCRRRCCFADVRCKMIRIKSFLSSLPVIRIRAGRGSLQEKIMIFTGKHEESSFLFNHRLLPDAAKDDDDDDECSGCCSRRRRCSREDDDDARFPDIFLDPTLFFLRRRRSDGAFRFFKKKRRRRRHRSSPPLSNSRVRRRRRSRPPSCVFASYNIAYKIT